MEDAVRDADLIIEAIPEELRMKVELFAKLDQYAQPHAILASNTSSLSIAEFTARVRDRRRCIGMHFFNPVPKMRLVEIIRTLDTADETVDTCVVVAHRMHKETVIVQEAPGFITSRINALIGNEAFAMLEAGVASASDIDKATKLGLNHPMGPFELVDLVGLDVRLKILEYLHQTLGEKYRPSPLLRKFVEEGRLGRKSGRGVYDYAGHEPHQPESGAKPIMKPLSERIVIRKGDITDMDVDAVVNAANNDLMLGAGVAGAILRKGGYSIQAECNEIGSIPVGYAAITGAGNLKARYVIHAASMGLGDMPTTAKSLRTSTAHSLRLAAERKLKSIAFPAVGTGVSGFSLDECAQIMLTETAQHLNGDTSLETAYFVLFDERARETFQRTWEKLQKDLTAGAPGA